MRMNKIVILAIDLLKCEKHVFDEDLYCFTDII